MVGLLQAGGGGNVEQFYNTLSMLSFTLLGLWWVVVQLRITQGEASPQQRRHIYSVLMFFLLPGLMSLYAVVDDSSTWWRLVFGITALVGMVEIALYYQAVQGAVTGPQAALRLAGFVDYVLVAFVSIRPAIARDLGLGTTGLQLEAVLVGGLFVIGIHMVYLELTRPREETPSDGAAGSSRRT